MKRLIILIYIILFFNLSLIGITIFEVIKFFNAITHDTKGLNAYFYYSLFSAIGIFILLSIAVSVFFLTCLYKNIKIKQKFLPFILLMLCLSLTTSIVFVSLIHYDLTKTHPGSHTNAKIILALMIIIFISIVFIWINEWIFTKLYDHKLKQKFFIKK